ncbi:hypothetical protein U5922_017865 [Aquicoccus sp. G2-2]|uniref:hypothetical protein n=1 Tax=Aquicoccus sp. G2-2 TaxID=3092120 RepID=UPI002ADF0CD5|nr:hypothetical protein [Aquicoccus sp. G2-2]MEA1115239.1 hypothetical protein [Aquicoccus sp. G2-2]
MKHPEPRDSKAPGEPVFFILEQDTLVATDLSQILQSAGPCRIVFARKLDEAARALADVPSLSVAFLEMDYAGFSQSWLARALHDRGALLIFTTSENTDASLRARGWGSLARPFTEQVVLDTLSSILKTR